MAGSLTDKRAFRLVLVLGLLAVLAIPGPALLQSRTLLPLDLLHNALLPWANDVRNPEFADHYGIDAIQEYLPIYTFHGSELRDGRFPSWNPYNRGGSAYIDNPVRLPFHPLKWLLLKLPADQVLDIGAVLHFALAFLAMAFYLRRLGLVPVAILFGALSWTFSAYFVFGFMHERQIAAIALAPLVLLLFEKLYAQPSGGQVLQTGFVAGASLLLAGPTAILVLIILLGLRLAGFWIFESMAPDRRRLGAMAAAAGIAFALDSPSLLSTAEGILNNTRYFDYSSAYATGQHAIMAVAGYLGLLVSAIHPYALGSRDSIDVLKLAGYTVRLAPYAGTFALVFAVLAMRKIRTRPATRWLLTLFAAGFVLLLPPVVEALSQRNIIIIVFGLVVCAAIGVDHYLGMSREQMRTTGRFVLFFVILVWAGFLLREAVLLVWQDRLLEALTLGIRASLPGYLFERYPEWKLASGARFIALQRLSSPANLLFLAGVTGFWLAWRAGAKPGRARWRYGVVTVACLAPVLFAAANVHLIDTRTYPVPDRPAYLDLASPDPGPPRVFIPLDNPHDRLLMPGNFPQFFGLAQARGYGSLFPLNTAVLTYGLPPEHPLFEVANVNYLLTARDSTVASEAFPISFYAGEMNVHAREHPVSRFHLSGRLRKAATREEAAGLARQDRRPVPERFFYLESLPEGYPGPFEVDGEIEVERVDTTRAEVTATLRTDALLIMGDSYYPGWRAEVNGAPREIRAVDGALRGVWLTRGENRVRFEFRHWPSMIGLGLQLALVAIVVAGFGIRRLRRRA